MKGEEIPLSLSNLHSALHCSEREKWRSRIRLLRYEVRGRAVRQLCFVT